MTDFDMFLVNEPTAGCIKKQNNDNICRQTNENQNNSNSRQLKYKF